MIKRSIYFESLIYDYSQCDCQVLSSVRNRRVGVCTSNGVIPGPILLHQDQYTNIECTHWLIIYDWSWMLNDSTRIEVWRNARSWNWSSENDESSDDVTPCTVILKACILLFLYPRIIILMLLWRIASRIDLALTLKMKSHLDAKAGLSAIHFRFSDVKGATNDDFLYHFIKYGWKTSVLALQKLTSEAIFLENYHSLFNSALIVNHSKFSFSNKISTAK